MIIPVGKGFMYIPHHVAHSTCENCREICEGGCNVRDYILIVLLSIDLICFIFLVYSFVMMLIEEYKRNKF